MSRTAHGFALSLTVLAATILLLVSCHPLVNPNDPASPFYASEPEDPGTTAAVTTLPQVVGWWAYAEHGSGQWLRLSIPTDRSYIESRSDFEICIEFSGPIDSELVGACYAKLYYNFVGTAEVRDNPPYFTFVDWIDTPWFPENTYTHYLHLAGSVLPENNGTRALLQLYGPNGEFIDERYFAWLDGDVNSDGQVPYPPSDDEDLVSSLISATVSSANPVTIRADVEPDGFVTQGDLDRYGFDSLRGNDILTVQEPDPSTL